MEFSQKFLILFFCINMIYSLPFCPKSNKSPEELKIDTSKNVIVNYLDKDYEVTGVGNEIFLKEDTYDYIRYGYSGPYPDSEFCPEDFKIPLQSDYENIINNLGSNAYSILTDKNGFNMTEGKYYLTNTKGKKNQFNKIFFYLEGKSLKFIEESYYIQNVGIRCLLNIDSKKSNFILPFDDRNVNLDEKILIKNKQTKFMNAYLWKINNEIFHTETIEYKFSQSGTNKIELWGKYINGIDEYICDYIYVNKKQVSSSQVFSESKIKRIETNIFIEYSHSVNFFNANCPIAPRTNGGYYIAIVSLDDQYLHILSYDRNDNLLKDFNTTEKAYPLDILSTDYGFAVYLKEVNYESRYDFTKEFHSYLNLYNKNFELINTVQIMNNKVTDDKTVDSNINKQVIKYGSNGSPVYGLRFIYSPNNGILSYSRGRIFLIFTHYNYFSKTVGGHEGDSAVTFNDILLDLDFGMIWSCSHSLIVSATNDNNYFWTASLSDAYPEGIRVAYTSKKNFTNEYDPINKKYNSRISGSDRGAEISGYIRGNHGGVAEGRLGGILYFEKYDLYCLVYAKTPNYSNDEKNGTSIIFISTWKFVDNKISNNKTYELKISKTELVMSLRAGKYGDDKIIIIYNETDDYANFWDYRNIIPKGTIPRLLVVTVPNMQIFIKDKKYDKLIMNTNEELRTFRDGVLIWASADKEGKLVINKIGTPILDDSYEDINYIITKEDVEKIRNETEDEENIINPDDGSDSSFFNKKNIIFIAAGVGGLILIGLIIFISIKCCKKKDKNSEDNKDEGLVPGGF